MGVAVSILLIVLFLRAIHPREIGDAFGEANYWYMIPAIGVLFVALAIRCLRWSILMRPVAAPAPSGPTRLNRAPAPTLPGMLRRRQRTRRFEISRSANDMRKGGASINSTPPSGGS